MVLCNQESKEAAAKQVESLQRQVAQLQALSAAQQRRVAVLQALLSGLDAGALAKKVNNSRGVETRGNIATEDVPCCTSVPTTVKHSVMCRWS